MMIDALDRISSLPIATPWDSVDPLEDEVSRANEDAVAVCDEFVEAFAQSDEGEIAKPQAVIGSRSPAWTIPLLCLGIGILACCAIVPAADDNRRMTWEREKLREDLEQIRKQVSVNDEFLKRVGNDPTLAERLAQRQMKMVREGSSVLDVKGASMANSTSPFLLTTIPPPPPMPAYKPVGGKLSTICLNVKSRLYMMGGGFICIAFGLVMGSSKSEIEFGHVDAQDEEEDAEKMNQPQMNADERR